MTTRPKYAWWDGPRPALKDDWPHLYRYAPTWGDDAFDDVEWP